MATSLSGAAAGAVALGMFGLGERSSTVGFPCLFRASTGAPCPFCGMTHSLLSFGAGNFAEAISLAPAIPIVVIAAAAMLVLGPHHLVHRTRLSWSPWITVVVLAGILGIWLARIAGLPLAGPR